MRQGTRLEIWTHVIVLFAAALAAAIQVAPKRLRGRMMWAPWAIASALWAAVAAYELPASGFPTAQGPLAKASWSFGGALFLTLLAGSAAIYAFGAAVECARGLKRGRE
jgi:hypothetical protein